MINFEYIWHVYRILSHFCPSVPYPTKKFMRGKLHHSLELQTRTYHSLQIYILYFIKIMLKGYQLLQYYFNY
jgi:hypothetical protein